MFAKPMMNVVALVIGALLVAPTPGLGQCCEVPELVRGDAAAGDWFGQSVGVRGNWAVLGAKADDDASTSGISDCDSGSAYVFLNSNGTWVEYQKLTPYDTACGDYFGDSVAICGDYLVVGAPLQDDAGPDAGVVYVFVNSDGTWVEYQKLYAHDAAPADRFGVAVSCSADHILVGAVWDDDGGSKSGSAYVFVNNGGSWVEEAKLTAYDADTDDHFGDRVSIDGDYAVVGAWRDECEGGGSQCGSAYAFWHDDSHTPEDPTDDLWVPMVPKLTAHDSAPYDVFGHVSISGDWIVVGAYRNDEAGTDAGAAYFFQRNDQGTPEEPSDDTWDETQKVTASYAEPYATFGVDASISGAYALIGASYNDQSPELGPGQAYLFVNTNETWVEECVLSGSDAQTDARFGHAVALHGAYALAGAYAQDQDGVGTNSGSAYAFVVAGPDCNSNGIPDECDILEGTSADEDGDGVPDECEGMYLDIKPGSCPNPLNRGSHGVLPVALLGTAEFDATVIDVSSVRLGRADGVGGLVAPHEGPPGPHSVFEDVGTSFDGDTCDCHDAGTDGFVDLSIKFKTDDVVADLLLDELDAGALVELVVTGELLGGTGFAASDCVRLVPPGTPPGSLSVQSSVAGAWIDVDPLDETLDGGGFADFQRGFPLSTVVTLTAEEWTDGRPLRGWQIGGLLHHMGEPSIEFTIDQDMTVRAVYGPTPSGSPKPPGEMTPDEMVPEAMQGQSAEAGAIDRR